MKVMIHSNAPWCGSGYGVQTAHALRILRELGHETACSASFGLAGNVLNIDGSLIIPGSTATDGFGVTAAPMNGQMWGADLLVTLLDAWVFEGAKMREAGQRWVALAPIDHEPIPRRVLERLREAWFPAAMCRSGLEAMVAEGLDPLYLPHTYDPAVYSAAPIAERTAAREKLGIPLERYSVGMVAANKGQPSRKSIPTVIEAFGELYRRHPDEVVLVLHMEMDSRHTGVNVYNALEWHGIPESAVRYSDQRAPAQNEKHMAALFACIDVLVNPAMGEGFGVPILEAAARGVPSIVGGWTAMPEVAGPAAWVIPREEALRHFTIQESYQYLPSSASVLDRMEEGFAEWSTSYGAPNSAHERRRKLAAESALPWALEHAAVHWHAALERVAERIADEAAELAAAPVVEVKG